MCMWEMQNPLIQNRDRKEPFKIASNCNHPELHRALRKYYAEGGTERWYLKIAFPKF